jgi:hypothetical protein
MKTNIIKYRNNFEADIGEKLVDWNYEPYHIPYVTKRKYIPDFTKGNILVEAKGYFRVGDTQKYKAIRDSLFSQELVFVLTNALDDGWDLLGTPHLDGNRFLQGLIRHIKVPTIKEPEKKK